MHNTRWLRWIGCGYPLLWLLMGSLSLAAASPLDRVTLQLKWKHQFQFAGYYAALEKGFYLDAGLDVRLLEAAETLEPAQVVLQGKADFGIAASDLALLRGKGQPVIALAAIYQHSPLILLALKRPDLESIHDLAGKKAMIEPHAAELLAYLAAESVPTDKLILMPLSFDPGELVHGRIDVMSAYSTDEPFLIRQAGLDYLTFNPRAGGIDFYGDTLFTTEAQVRNHPQRVKNFLEASLRGWQYALDHPDEIAALIYSKYSQRHSLEHLRFEAEQSRRLILPEVVQIGYMNPGRWKHIAEVYAQLGMASPDLSLKGFLYDRTPPPDLTGFYLALAGIIAISAIAGFIAVRLYQLKLAMKTIAEQRDLQEGLFANIPLGVTVVDRSGRLVHTNRGFTALTGYTQDDLQDMNDWMVRVYPDPVYRQSLLQDRQYIMRKAECAGPIDVIREYRMVCKDGTAKEVEFRIRHLADGRALYTMTDVTERNHAEKQLRTLEERYRTLVEKAPFPIVISHLTDGIVLYANPEAAEKFKIAQHHVPGKNPRTFYVNPDDREQLIVRLKKQGFLRHYEVQMLNTTGQPFWADLSATLITFENQPAIFFAVLDINERKELQNRLETMAMTDELTGLFNRRYFTQHGTEELIRAHRYPTPLSLLMLDVDHFKAINDRYGHEGGDEALRRLAVVLRQSLREVDVAGRLGGEEFGVILPNTGLETALALAERLRRTVEQQTVEVRGHRLQLTVSIGVATRSETTLTFDDLLRRADVALYQAKHGGRNQVTAAGNGK